MPEGAFRFDPLQPGDPTRAGRYDLLARVGLGGMGRVYLSFTPGGRPIAVKVLKSDVTQDLQFAERFAREVHIAQQVSGPHVAPLLDADPHAPEPWLASAYVAGPSLQELVASTGPLPPEDVLLLAYGTAQALQTIHHARVIHRDLKPANILLDESGPKVIDFGIVKSLAATQATHNTATRIGTPAYMSPEQATGQSVTTASDVFSLGATLYFLATGRVAFEAENAIAMAYRMLHDEPDLSGLDGRVRHVVEACLVKAPESRITPAQVMAECQTLIGAVPPGAYVGITQAREAIRGRVKALAALSSSHAATITADLNQPPPPPPQPADSGRAVYMAGIAVAITAVLVAGVWWLVNVVGTHNTDASIGPPTGPASAAQSTAPAPPTDTQASTDTSSPTPVQSSSPPTDPAHVVDAFYNAINAKDWQTAWALGGDNFGQSYSAFVNGFSNTASDSISAQDAGATAASIQLTATQNDGSVQQYSGTYTVVNGIITGAHVSRVN